jgi:hypothetical protein
MSCLEPEKEATQGADGGEPIPGQFAWEICRASEEIRGEIVLSRLIQVSLGPRDLYGTNALTIQLYEMSSGTRWIRLWDQDRSLPYDEFILALRRAEESLGWTEPNDTPAP